MSETTQIVPVKQKTPVSIGHRGIELTDMDSLVRFSQAVAASGLSPKGIDKPESIFVAIQMGLEVGLTPMAALQNIAVINGRPTIWGDAQLGVVRATGELEEFSEWYEVAGQKTNRNPTTFGDDVCAVCRIKRRGYEAQESAFSVADSKKAQLWNKQGPWSQYPARMLRFRARGFALRDNFGDALRGMLSTEEARDIEVDVTPRSEVGTTDLKRPVGRPPGASNKPKAVEATVTVTETIVGPSVPSQGKMDVGHSESLLAVQKALEDAVNSEGGDFNLFAKAAIIEGWDHDAKVKADQWKGFWDVPDFLAKGLATIPSLKAAMDERR